MRMSLMTLRRAALTALPLLALAGCAAFQADDVGTEEDDGGGGAVTVFASFYPLEYLAGQIAGDRLEGSSLTPPGADPHRVERPPRTVADHGGAGLPVVVP